MNRILILVSLLTIAIACYLVGFARGAFIVIAIGMLFELGFWVGLFGSGKTTKETIENSAQDD